MTEAELQEAVVELAGWLKYKVYHTYDSRRSTAGFPDLVLVGRGRVIFIELKSDKGRLGKHQVDWYTWLVANGADVWVFRPYDWTSGNIKRVLETLGGGDDERR